MLKERTKETSTVYLSIKNYAEANTRNDCGLCIESDGEQQGFHAVKVNNPSTGESMIKHVKFFDALTGYGEKIEKYDRTDEASGVRYRGFYLWMYDESGESVRLDFPYGKPAYRKFVKIAGSVNWDKPLSISAWLGRDDKLAFVIKQDGAALKWFHSADNPNGMPVAERDEMGDLNFRPQEIFLIKRMTEVVAVHCAEAHERRMGATAEPADDTFADEPKGAHVNTRRDPQGSGEASKRGESRKPAQVNEDEVPF